MSKDNLYRNGELKKRHAKIIPDGLKRLPIPELRAWLLVPINLTQEQCEKHKAEYLRKYAETLVVNSFRT